MFKPVRRVGDTALLIGPGVHTGQRIAVAVTAVISFPNHADRGRAPIQSVLSGGACDGKATGYVVGTCDKSVFKTCSRR